MRMNRFVLDRVFDLLLVDPGVQHTVTSITQYIVILIAVFLGFQSAKLGEIVQIIMGALILGLGLILKDPTTDFVAYFIILVQRPLKIGDYISIDEDITGAVRRITARAVILRRKNSTTLIVPNSYVISHTITNGTIREALLRSTISLSEWTTMKTRKKCGRYCMR